MAMVGSSLSGDGRISVTNRAARARGAGMKQRLLKLEVENFLSLRRITLPLRGLNVLVGPNGAGKTNVLEVFRFLADVIRTDLEPALSLRGGFDEVVFWGGEQAPSSFRIGGATWTRNSSANAPMNTSSG